MSGTSSSAGNGSARKTERLGFLNREAAEVYLLLDFLSGRADRSLRPTQEERARSVLDQQQRSTRPADAKVPVGEKEQREIEEDLCDPTRLVYRTMRIKYPIQPEDKEFEADATFLMRARDVLNTRAWPATGATIAFTSMVSCPSPRKRTTGEGVSEFAARAYPQFRWSAFWLASWITGVMYALLFILVLALGVSAYTAWGKIMLDTLDAVRRDDGATQQELSAARGAATPAAIILLCDAKRSDNPPACGHADEIKARYAATSHHLASWEEPLRGITAAVVDGDDNKTPIQQKRTEQWATAILAILGSYVMPILYALLGSIAFVLRRHYDRLAANLLSPRDLRANSIRLLLGVVIGGCIGLVYTGSSAAQTTGVLGAAVTLSTSAIAFLAGYGVEGVFKMLDSLITQVFRVSTTDKPVQPVA